jgi:hypothetical protein
MPRQAGSSVGPSGFSMRESRIGLRLSHEPREAAERRGARSARPARNSSRCSPIRSRLPGWGLVVTTLPSQQWTDQQVLRLYQARWHIELLAETDQTAAQAAALTLHEGGDGSADADRLVAGLFLARRGEQRRTPGDGRCDELHAPARSAAAEGAGGTDHLVGQQDHNSAPS